MSFHVSMDFVEINQSFYNLSFIILKNSSSSNVWSHFFHRVTWNNDVQVPKNFYVLDLGHNGRHFFHPCAPFHLNEDDCGSWLTWATVRPNNSEADEIKMLQFRGDPEEILGNPENKTEISAHLQHSLWADQLSSTQQPALGNLSRMENLVRQTINNQLRNIPNTIVNKLRYELRDHGRERRRSRSRSPERRASATTAVMQPTPQMVLPQQYYIPQQQQVQPGTQVLSQQQVLPPQQVQWNSAVTAATGNNPQPGLLYAPQRMNP